MKHHIFGKKLKRTTGERKSLFRSLISSIILKGKIKTTEAKAKAIKGQIDRFVSWSKKGTLSARRQLLQVLDKRTVDKLMGELAPIFEGRSSGFTQIIKIGPRKGDNAPVVLLRWVGWEKLVEKKTAEKETVKAKKETPEKDAKAQNQKEAKKDGK